ncbi:hypothetical protein CAAN3_08S04280 [[Candida] anglica]
MTREQIHEQATFVNSFWGNSKESGFRVVQTKIHHGLATMKELMDFYQERIVIEKEYTKKLEQLNKKTTLGSHETGTLKVSLDKLSHENEEMCKFNTKFAKTVAHTNFEKLSTFYASYSKSTSKIEHHMSKLVSRRADAYKNYETYKTKYRDECALIKSLQLQCQATWGGKEMDKIEFKLTKLRNSNVNTRSSYIQAVATLRDVDESYVRDWAAILRDIYLLEAERIQVCKVNCFTYCNNIATLCVEHDHAVDLSRTVFAQVNANEDLQQFGEAYGTGNKIHNPPEFVEFMNGHEEKPEGKDYVIADFGIPEITRSQSIHSSMQPQQSPQQVPQQNSPQHSIPHASPQHSIPHASPAQHVPSPQQIPSDVTLTSPSGQSRKSVSSQGTTVQHRPENGAHDFSINNNNLKRTSFPTTGTMLDKVSLPPPTSSYGTSSQYDTLGVPKTPSPTRKAPKSSSNYSSSEGGDVFSLNDPTNPKFGASNGSSNYSQPTNYTSSSVYSTTSSDRNWATPRRKEQQQMKQVQDRINRNSKELPHFPTSMGMNELDMEPPAQKHIPIQKDFSIDFIAKALEDLNSGGNGDINQYRRSVRRAKEREQQQQYQYSQTAPSTPYESRRPNSDYVDDHDEVATRYGSINFKSPSTQAFAPSKSGTVKKKRPQSMYESSNNQYGDDVYSTKSAATSNHMPRRSLSKTPSKSYTNLHSFIQDSPSKSAPPVDDNGYTPSGQPYVSKVKAMYSYKPQHHGELGFKKNTYMYVLHKQEDNWYVCELAHEPGAGTVGLVPGNYVKDDYSF